MYLFSTSGDLFFANNLLIIAFYGLTMTLKNAAFVISVE